MAFMAAWIGNKSLSLPGFQMELLEYGMIEWSIEEEGEFVAIFVPKNIQIFLCMEISSIPKNLIGNSDQCSEASSCFISQCRSLSLSDIFF